MNASPAKPAHFLLKTGVSTLSLMVFGTLVLAQNALPRANSPFHEVRYAPSTLPGELVFGVSYRLWVPPGVKTLRGVVVHQHGCGEAAGKGGETAADDLHWQALARKWDCALLGPSYQQPDQAECALWCDPRNGSEKTFLRALAELSALSGHPELPHVPWVLWGHSGGANWVGTMLLLHPGRVVGVWLRSGSPRLISASNALKFLEIPAAAYTVPVMCNPGVKEKEGRFEWVWATSVAFFREFRAKKGLIGFAPDPRTSHECGDSRYLAIPFLEACLSQRLPKRAGTSALSPMSKGLTKPVLSLLGGLGMDETVWLPNERVAKAWSEYVLTGAISDDTAPPAPEHVRVSEKGELTWESKADFESGLAGFVIERDGKELARLPLTPGRSWGRALFQGMSYHDTPTRPLPEMRFTDPEARMGQTYTYQIRSINAVGLTSASAKAMPVRATR